MPIHRYDTIAYKRADETRRFVRKFSEKTALKMKIEQGDVCP